MNYLAFPIEQYIPYLLTPTEAAGYLELLEKRQITHIRLKESVFLPYGGVEEYPLDQQGTAMEIIFESENQFQGIILYYTLSIN
jgi:hypothetical protein